MAALEVVIHIIDGKLVLEVVRRREVVWPFFQLALGINSRESAMLDMPRTNAKFDLLPMVLQ